MDTRNALCIGRRRLPLESKPLLVGILNVTPDSFSDGGDFGSVTLAVERALEMIEEGASIIDIGGESTRPNADKVEFEDEIIRVVPIIEALVERDPEILISIDTSKSEVARAALQAGACIVNDVTGLTGDSRMADVISEENAACFLMFNARLMHGGGDILARVLSGLRKSVSLALEAGIGSDSIVLDPGIGFGTSRDEDLLLLANLAQLRIGDCPVLLGASRKRVTGDLLDLTVSQRLETTLATTVVGVESGVEFFRVHDVQENSRAARMAKLIYDKRNG